MRLELKLVLLVLALTTFLLGGLGLALGASLERWSEQVVDDELRRRADVLIHEAHFDDGRLELDDDDDLATRGLPFRIELEDGRLLFGTDDWPAASLTGLGFSTIDTHRGERVRVLSETFTAHRAPGRLVVRVAAPLKAVSGLVVHFRRKLIFSLVLAAVLSGLGALALGRWFLRPLNRLAAEVDGLEASAVGRVGTRGLDPALAKLAGAFNGLLERVAAVMAGQRDFVGRASHALRTPLAGILSEAEVALRKDRTAESYRATLEGIVATTRDAARLTDGLLALTRADAATASAKERVVVAELFDEVARLFYARVETAGLSLGCKVDPGLVVTATRARLREALDALVDNAVRYTPRGGVVTLSAREDGDGVVLEVHDTGPGVTEAERARVFERFFRGSAAERSGQPGSGLGLAVVKALIEAEGGQVSVRGGTFSLSLRTRGEGRGEGPSQH